MASSDRVLTWWRAKKIPKVFLNKNTKFYSWRFCLYDLVISPRPHVLIPSHWWLGSNPWILRDTNIQSIATGWWLGLERTGRVYQQGRWGGAWGNRIVRKRQGQKVLDAYQGQQGVWPDQTELRSLWEMMGIVKTLEREHLFLGHSSLLMDHRFCGLHQLNPNLGEE